VFEHLKIAAAGAGMPTVDVIHRVIFLAGAQRCRRLGIRSDRL